MCREWQPPRPRPPSPLIRRESAARAKAFDHHPHPAVFVPTLTSNRQVSFPLAIPKILLACFGDDDDGSSAARKSEITIGLPKGEAQLTDHSSTCSACNTAPSAARGAEGSALVAKHDLQTNGSDLPGSQMTCGLAVRSVYNSADPSYIGTV